DLRRQKPVFPVVDFAVSRFHQPLELDFVLVDLPADPPLERDANIGELTVLRLCRSFWTSWHQTSRILADRPDFPRPVASESVRLAIDRELPHAEVAERSLLPRFVPTDLLEDH